VCREAVPQIGGRDWEGTPALPTVVRLKDGPIAVGQNQMIGE